MPIEDDNKIVACHVHINGCKKAEKIKLTIIKAKLNVNINYKKMSANISRWV